MKKIKITVVTTGGTIYHTYPMAANELENLATVKMSNILEALEFLVGQSVKRIQVYVAGVDVVVDEDIRMDDITFCLTISESRVIFERCKHRFYRLMITNAEIAGWNASLTLNKLIMSNVTGETPAFEVVGDGGVDFQECDLKMRYFSQFN